MVGEEFEDDETEPVNLSVRLRPEVFRSLAEEAERQGLTISAIVQKAILAYAQIQDVQVAGNRFLMQQVPSARATEWRIGRRRGEVRPVTFR